MAMSGTPKSGDQAEEQIIIDLMKQRKLQQDALKKIITSMDKSSDENKDTKESDVKATKGTNQNQTKLI